MPRTVTRWLVTRTVEEEVDAMNAPDAMNATRIQTLDGEPGRDPITTSIVITRIPTPEV